MSEINYQALREAAESASKINWTGLEDDLNADGYMRTLTRYIQCHSPIITLSLLDERDALNERIAELEAELVSQTYKLNELAGNSPVTPDGWISCSDRMPPLEKDVLVYSPESGEQFVGRYQGDRCEFTYAYIDDTFIVCDASHWMPLPNPPQEVE